MKTKLSLVLAIIVSATTAFAKIEPSVTVLAGSSNHIFKVLYKSEKTTKVKVTIFNSNYEMIFTETISNMDSFSRPYNFSTLPEGEYFIEVSNGSGKKVEKVNNKEGSIKNSAENIISVRKLNNDKSKYLITSVCKGINMINVSVFNSNGDLLHNESHLVDGSFGIVYNLINNENCAFVVTDEAGDSHAFKF